MPYKILRAFRDKKADGAIRVIGSEFKGDESRIKELLVKKFIAETKAEDASAVKVEAKESNKK